MCFADAVFGQRVANSVVQIRDMLGQGEASPMAGSGF